jgi:hypothetical protein
MMSTNMKTEMVTSKAHNLSVANTLPLTLFLSLLLVCQPGKEVSAAPEAAASAATNTATALAAPQGNVVRYEAIPGSEARVDGTSTIHDWTVTNKLVRGFIEADVAFPESALKPAADTPKPKVEVSILVRALKSYDKKMDEIMLEHMEEPKFKKIEYKLVDLKPKGAAATGGKFTFDAVGALTVHGTTVTNTMAVTIEKLDGGKLKVTGSAPLKMTSFGVKPPAPALALGLIKTGDDIKVSFEWVTAQKVETPRAK